MLCGLGFISAMVVSFLDVYGVKQLGDADNLVSESKKVVSLAALKCNILNRVTLHQ